MLSYMADCGHGRRLVFGLSTKSVDLDAVPDDKPDDDDIGDFNWALRQLANARAVELIHHRGENYICPTFRILSYVQQ